MRFNKSLIANRGEIAVRIIRACRELGISTVAIYSQSDKDSLHVKLADESYCIGKSLPKDTYLNINNIINVAIHSKADAIHPGYGFLSESTFFAKACEEFNICFIGPDYRIIDMLGDKSNAKETMKKAGVPIVPGTEGKIEDKSEAIKIAEEIGLSLIHIFKFDFACVKWKQND